MKTLAPSLLILFGAVTGAISGPESFSGKEMKQVAPTPPVCPGWTGFYIGGFGGYTFAPTDVNLRLGGSEWSFFPIDQKQVEQVGSRDLDSSTGQAGGFIGYNYQWRNWVFGVEAAGGGLWLDESAHHDFDSSGGLGYITDTSFESHYLFTIAPRIGYAFCRWLPYVTGGMAIGDLDFRQHVIGVDLGNNEFGSEHDTNVGWMIGGGLEYALTNHWRIRAQYQYVDLGSLGFDHTELNLPQLFSGHSEAELREHTASFALIFQF